jgi:D-xylose 1-dehydrogenase (NADP+, D-xylono-1,5-lactone-forming)
MDPVRLGLLSTAAINAQSLGGARETDRVAVVAVGSRDGAKAQAYAAEHGIERSYGSYDALLADDEVDAIYIGLPNGMHHEWTLRALEAGKHVLVEKPYTRHTAEAEAAFTASKAAGLVLMEAFMYRHHPQTAIVRDLVVGGAIGRLQAVNATFTFPLEDLTNVRALPELDGGALMDVGCYCVSAIRLLAGEPRQVSGEQVTGSTGVDMGFHGTLRCADDVIGQLEASFRSPRRQHVEVVGAEGVVTVEAPFRVDWGGDVLLARRDREALAEPEVVAVPQANAYRLQLDNLADAIQGRAPQLLGRDDALGQARTIEALYGAAAEGRTVAIATTGETEVEGLA